MHYHLTQTTPPAAEPLTTDEAKTQCRIALAITHHDTEMAVLIKAARQQAERLTGRQIINATWDQYYDCFPYGAEETLKLARNPVSSVTHVKYLQASDGVLTTWSSTLQKQMLTREPAEIGLAFGQSWPVPRSEQDAVVVRFVAGYGAAGSAVPELLKQAMLMMIADWFNKRMGEGEVSQTVKHLLTQFNIGDEFLGYAA